MSGDRKTLTHLCHHPTCEAAVPPEQLACKPHWFQLPLDIRNEIWRTFRRGQEVDKRPSSAYWTAFKKAQELWLAKLNGREVRTEK